MFLKDRDKSVSAMSDYHYLDYYHDYASLPTSPLKNILCLSTLGLIACQIILAVNENLKLTLICDELFYA